ncbi:DoxX [Caulifigura coniformis]|uniref:DoxX n=1 Tax=Caulifigura coniformis TaxID=2527983 RepID=A0A517SCB2_9PLAN|nr:DoxX family membrane protein [Caulifigura coniformis]QDT53744.1 DoxX [Caulifigura coniformis]
MRLVNDWKRISLAAVILIVLLRLSIGWQFLYEGLWKYDQLKGPNPWSAEGYLKAAQGPFRDHFRNMTGDPDDLGWFDFDTVNNRWTRWRDTFVAHYGLNEKQVATLDQLLTGPKDYRVSLPQLPPKVAELDRFVRDELRSGPKLSYDAARKQLVLDASTPLKPDETTLLLAASDLKRNEQGELVAKENAPEGALNDVSRAWYLAIETLDSQASKLPYRSKLLAQLKGDPDKVGVIAKADQRYAPVMGTERSDGKTVEMIKYGEIQEYKDMLAAYKAAEKKAKTDFELAHLEATWAKIQAKRTGLAGPIKALEKSLKDDATKMLTREQLGRGPAPREVTPLTKASDMAMWSLLILGPLLLVGLCTRLAAVAGAAMLLSFYLVVPPWPGVPQPPGPEHSFIVNKNLIEVIALLAIAFMPTGSWFGLDGIFRWLFRRGKAPATK